MKLHNVLIRPTDLFEEILRRKLISGGGVPAVLQTLTGISPLTLLNVARRGIESLTQFGKCEQASTPTPSVPVDIKCNNGILKMLSSIADFTSGYIKRSTNTVVSYVGTKDSMSYTFKSSAGYVGKVFPTTIGQTYTVNYDNLTSSTSSMAKVRVVELDSDISQIDDNYGTDDKTYPYTFTATKPYVGIWLLYPYTVTTSSVTIGVTGLTLQEGNIPLGTLIVEGTDEVITVCGKNLFDKSKPYLNVFVNANTNAISQGTTQWSFCVPCKPNTTYVLSGMIGGSSRWGSFTSNAIGSVATAFQSGNGTVTTGANDKWLIGLVYATSGTGTTYDYRDTLQIEYGETASEYESYHEQTASVTNLFAAGDYKDEQEIISGVVTRKCGVLVLDGTEEWSSDGATLQVTVADCVRGTIRKVPMLCTHYPIVSNGASWNDTPTNSMYGTPGGKIGVKNTMSADDYKSFLSAQYANGTPVIVVYPLAEPTTEQVTAQQLTARDTATITAQTNNISDITLEVQYWQKGE